MSLRALIVEDDPQLAEVAEETVASLGHVPQIAACQRQARQQLAENDYDYVLLDLCIPLDVGRLAKAEHGEHLLREIAASGGPPVIVTTACGRTEPQTAVKLMKLGAVDFVNKPYDGLLDQKILELLGSMPQAGGPQQLAPFTGGELTFYPDRIALAGIDVQHDRTVMHDVAGVLAHVPPSGGYDAQRIAKQLQESGIGCDAEAVAGAIYRLRNACRRALLQAGIECGADDVVVNDRRAGYWFSAKVVVRIDPAESSDSPLAMPGAAPRRRARAEERQKWILHQLSLGTQLKSAQAASHLQCSQVTVLRDIDVLRDAGHEIQFTGSPRWGYFTLVRSKSA